MKSTFPGVVICNCDSRPAVYTRRVEAAKNPYCIGRAERSSHYDDGGIMWLNAFLH